MRRVVSQHVLSCVSILVVGLAMVAPSAEDLPEYYADEPGTYDDPASAPIIGTESWGYMSDDEGSTSIMPRGRRLPVPPVLEVGRMIAVPPGTPTAMLRRWRFHRARPHITLRRDEAHSAVALDGSWDFWPFRGRAARLIIDGEKIRNVEFWINDPAMTRDADPVPTGVHALMHTSPTTERRGLCHVSHGKAKGLKGEHAALFVRNEAPPPLGTGLRAGEGWLEFGDAQEPAWLASCDARYASLGYVLGMHESDALAVWIPVDGRRRRVANRANALKVRTVFPHHHEGLLDALVRFDAEGYIARIDVSRFSRHRNESVADSEQTGACHRADGMRCYETYRQQHLAAIERDECPDYLTEFTSRWGEPLTRYEKGAGCERAVWLDEEAGVAVAAEQWLDKECTEISFTMRRATSLDGSMEPGALYALIRNEKGSGP